MKTISRSKNPFIRFCIYSNAFLLLLGSIIWVFNVRAANSPSDYEERSTPPVTGIILQRDGLHEILNYMRAHPELFPAERQEEPVLKSKEEREAILRVWSTFLDYLLALENTSEHTSEFYKLRSPERQEAFHLHNAAFVSSYRAALEFIEIAERNPANDALFNEAQPHIGFPNDTYARFKFKYLNVRIASRFTAIEALRKTSNSEAPKHLRALIETDTQYIWNQKGEGTKLTAENALLVVKDTGHLAWFPVQMNVSEWMSHVRVWRPGVSLISEDLIQKIKPRMEPGDILLERREWFLTNVGIPGYWPHAALYIGTPEERTQYFKDSEILRWAKRVNPRAENFEDLLKLTYPDAYAKSMRVYEGHPTRVIESIAEGVTFTTIEHSAAADSFAALRPRLPKLEKAIAIYNAYSYAGRPYDYNFDFLTDQELVCTELVYKSYQPDNGFKGLALPLTEVAGHMVTPPNEIARLFTEEYQKKNQQFDFVLMLDADEKNKTSNFVGVETFKTSWKRPKWHIVATQLKD